MVQCNDSLLYQCFKARYFPRSSFLEAKVSPNCLYVWRSLMAAQPILLSGHCQGVGNGLSINVLKDRWIPSYPTNSILHPVHEDVEGMRVADLINPDLHTWRTDKIMANFHREEAKDICQIPLSHRDVNVTIIWLQNSKESSASSQHIMWLGIWGIKQELQGVVLNGRSRLQFGS